MTGSEPEQAPARRFPALDPEPPPRPWWRRLLRVAVIVAVPVVVFGVIVAIDKVASSGGNVAADKVSSGGGGRSHATPATGPPNALPGGEVLVATAHNAVVSAEPDGRAVKPVQGLAPVGSDVEVTPDGHYLVTTAGEVYSLAGGRAERVDQAASARFGTGRSAAVPDALADHEKDLVMVSGSSAGATRGDNPLSLVPLSGGPATPLGSGDKVAGDPASLGVIASVAASGGDGVGGIADAEVDLRDAGAPAVVLGTAAELNKDLGQPVTSATSLVPWPNPSGSLVAIVLTPTSGKGDAGVVVVDRRGQDVASVPAGTGPAFGQPVTWSPDGQSLAYLTIGDEGVQVGIVMPGGSSDTEPLNNGDTVPGVCLWAPDDQSLLCDTYNTPTQHNWSIVPISLTDITEMSAPGALLAWLPAGSDSPTGGRTP